MIDDNHSMGDGDEHLLAEEDLDDASLYAPGTCKNILGYDPEEGDIICGSACNPSEQLCHYCRTRGHRMTGMF